MAMCVMTHAANVNVNIGVHSMLLMRSVIPPKTFIVKFK